MAIFKGKKTKRWIALGALCGFTALSPFAFKKMKEAWNTANIENQAKQEQRITSEANRQQGLCFSNIESNITREEVDRLVSEVKTPIEAFENVKRRIKFGRGPYNQVLWEELFMGRRCNRWHSMTESYSLGKGVCIDGAIAFAAMLSDNPEYAPKLLSLTPKEGRGSQFNKHAIAAFTENGKIGYASFNDPDGKENLSYFHPAEFSSIEEMVSKIDNKGYGSYKIVELDSETMKYGRKIDGNEVKRKFRTKAVQR